MGIVINREEALQKAAQKLDISPSKYKQAMVRYESMWNYLVDCEYEGTDLQPEIYLQGSFRLGTEIRPYIKSKDADYDIDIVCRLEHKKEATTAKTVKHQVGGHLKVHGTYQKMLDDEGKRCWTLNYAEQDGIGFHMDILPCVQESKMTFKEYYWDNNPIAVTNRLGEIDTYNWSSSNPKGFARWFFEKNKIVFESVKQAQKQAIFENYKSDHIFNDTNEIPNIHVKTPLQRAIQILKRHRDIRFCQHANEICKPISMIITVLAAQVYLNETSIYETLKNLIEKLSQHANQLNPTFQFNESIARSSYNLITRTKDGKWYIPNPTNADENFADRWHENDHAKAKAFFQWVRWARDDLVNIAEQLNERYYDNILINPDKKSPAISKSYELFNVPHRQLPESQWPVNLNYQALVSASYNKNGWRLFPDGSTSFQLSSGDQIERGKKICFKAKTTVPLPFQVYWQVVNTGLDATIAKCLRGDFYQSSGDCAFELGTKTRIESTAYKGNHWVECLIVKNGVCVARSGEFVVSIV